MFAVETVNGNAQTRVFIALPLDHVVLCLAKEPVLWTKKRGEPEEVAIVSF